MRNGHQSTYRYGIHISLMRVAAIAAAMLMLTVLTVTRSQAAFTSATSNPSNTFSAGTVVLTDDSTSAIFTATGMAPGQPPTVECITLTYTGSLTPAQVRMYGSTTGTLGTYLDMTIEVGTGGSFGDCTGFVAGGPAIYNATLANYVTSHTAWASGLGVWSPAANPESRTLRFTISVQDNNLAQGLSADATFTWEAQH